MATATVRPAKGAEDELVRMMRMMATRMPWSLGTQYVEAAGLHVSRGWKETIEAAKSRLPVDAAYAKAKALLHEALVTHTFVGNKQVIWYGMNFMAPDVQKAVRAWALDTNKAPLVDPGMKGFNVADAPTTSDGLETLIGKAPRIVAARLNASDQFVVHFFGARAYTSRETIDVSQWPAEQRNRIGDYFELIGLKARNVPTFDTVVFDLPRSRVELRIDVQPGMTSDGQGGAHLYLIEALNRVLFPLIKASPMGQGLVNLFPAVDKIYRDKKAGQVESLGFVATGETTSSNNTGQVHRRRGQDLREDPFHTGGRGAVKSVKPYSIGTSWEAPSKMDKLLLELKGSVRMIHGLRPALIQQANFLGCATGTDFDFLSDMLAEHLLQPKK